MTQIELLLLEVLDASLHNKTLPKISKDDWNALFSEMQAQCVEVLPADHYEEFPLDAAGLADYLGSVARSLQYFHTIMEEQGKAVRLLREAGIASAVLKGCGAAMSYPHPEYRTMGDIDLLAEAEHFKEACEVLLSHGYTIDGNETPENFDRHIGFYSPDGIEIELHHHFSNSLHTNKKQNEALDRILCEAVSDCEDVTLSDHFFPALPPLANGLVLLGHIRQHLGDGLGLRQIIDWMMYVEQYLDDAFWASDFAAAAEKTGMKQLALTATAMCRKYLGLADTVTWCKASSADEEALCDRMMEYVLARGNFGRKMDNKEAVSLSRLRMLKNPLEFFATAQKFGQANWKFLKKHPNFKCIAWLYQICIWPVRAIRKGYTPAGVLSHKKKADAESEFLHQLMKE